MSGKLIRSSLVLALAGALLAPTPAPAAVDLYAMLVKDIRPGSEFSFPFGLTSVGETLFFSADDGTNGVELWKSDGTAAGTVMVKDINPGPGHSSPSGLINVGGTLFFRANDGINGVELWKSDGTASGTVMVKDINPGAGNSTPWQFANVGGTLFLNAGDGINGEELWKSDGTAAGTVMVKDIRPGSTGSAPSNLTNVGGTVLFFASDGIHGRELWRSDGTASGTVMVRNINPATSSIPAIGVSVLTNVGGTLFFAADDGTNGRELWKAGYPRAKSVTLRAKPKRVAKGKRTRLTAILSPCPAFAGHTVRFQRRTATGWKTFATRQASATCRARARPRINRATVFRARSPKQGPDHLAGTSNRVRVRLRR